MKTQGQIEPLERLALLDAELRDLNEQLSRERESLDKKKQTVADLEAKLTRDRQGIEEMERVRNELMLELRQMSNQIEKSREKLARCRTEREANAAQREVEELRKLYRDRELEVEKLNVLLDQGRQEVDKTSKEREGVMGELGQTEGDTHTLLGEVGSKAAEKETQRKELVALVSPAIYRRYEQVRKRKGTALAFTHEGTCSECHMLLPPMLYQQLRRNEEFGQCPSCHRILYYRAAPAADTAAQAEGRSSGP